MLVLTRTKGEQITIGDDVVVTVIATGKKTRIGIEAPQAKRILRGELATSENPKTVEAGPVESEAGPPALFWNGSAWVDPKSPPLAAFVRQRESGVTRE